MKNNKIIFEASSNHVFEVREKPVPATQFIPDWWKKIPKYATENKKLILEPYASITVKQCAPNIDMFSSGYIIPLWADLLVTKDNDGYPFIQWTTTEHVVGAWGMKQSQGFEVPDGYSDLIFKYYHGWNIKTSPGWSTLFIHPAGYNNLPIRSISGIVDTDILTTDINCPFFIKKDFEGIIPKGTPMVQLIPFKREQWESEYTVLNGNKHQLEREKLFTKIYGYYSSKRAKKVFK